MLILYYKPTCSFCRRVLAVIDRLQLEVDLRDIESNPEHAEALVAHGGKRQAPYLIDEAKGVALYESDAIVAHLQKAYGAPAAATSTRPQVHVGGSVCLACEG
jgi:glutaredoxin 3